MEKQKQVDIVEELQKEPPLVRFNGQWCFMMTEDEYRDMIIQVRALESHYIDKISKISYHNMERSRESVMNVANLAVNLIERENSEIDTTDVKDTIYKM